MIQQATVNDVQAVLTTEDAAVIDVREYAEFNAGHVPQATHVPMHTIPLRVDEIPSGRKVFVICESGSRSWQVAAFLQQRGTSVINVHGGMGMWRAAGFPVEVGVPA